MRKVRPSQLGMVFSILFLLITGCGDKKGNEINKAVEPPSVLIQTKGVKTVNEALRNLYLDAAAVDTLNGRLTFRFYVDEENDMVIRGWKSNFDKNPPIVDPKPATLSNAKILAGTYLGNILLNANVLQEIKRKVGTGPGKFAYLKFVPMIDNRPGSVGELVYRLIYTNKAPYLKAMMMGNDSSLNLYDSLIAPPASGDEDSGFMLNPSPPRKETDQ